MEINEYQYLAMVSANKNLSKEDMLSNGVMGLCGESGEVIDIVKKHLHHGHELDKKHIFEELGDVMWYIAELCTTLDFKLEDVMIANIEKLKKRYPEGFSKERSINR